MDVAVSVEYISIYTYHVTNRYWYKSHIVSLSANKIIYIGIVILSVSFPGGGSIIIISAVAVVVWRAGSRIAHQFFWHFFFFRHQVLRMPHNVINVKKFIYLYNCIYKEKHIYIYICKGRNIIQFDKGSLR